MSNWTDEDALRLDISMALSKIKTKPRGDREDVYRKMVAEQIVAHLKAVELALREGAADATAQVLARSKRSLTELHTRTLVVRMASR